VARVSRAEVDFAGHRLFSTCFRSNNGARKRRLLSSSCAVASSTKRDHMGVAQARDLDRSYPFRTPANKPRRVVVCRLAELGQRSPTAAAFNRPTAQVVHSPRSRARFAGELPALGNSWRLSHGREARTTSFETRPVFRPSIRKARAPPLALRMRGSRRQRGAETAGSGISLAAAMTIISAPSLRRTDATRPERG